MKSIAIIPARSGSKGLPDKNILNLNGQPLIYYTIKAAIDSLCFDAVMVSTDSKKYAEIAKECGAEVPFLRSQKLSSDTAGSWDVVREVLSKYENMGKTFEYVALLQPTSPLRNANDIREAFEKLAYNETGSVVSITPVEHPVQWCFTLPDNYSMLEYANSPYNKIRRQDLEMYYRINGAIYLVDAVKIMNKDYNFYRDNCYAYMMPNERSIDIDCAMDLIVADTCLRNLK